jgi:hypothetical protein
LLLPLFSAARRLGNEPLSRIAGNRGRAGASARPCGVVVAKTERCPKTAIVPVKESEMNTSSERVDLPLGSLFHTALALDDVPRDQDAGGCTLPENGARWTMALEPLFRE